MTTRTDAHALVFAARDMLDGVPSGSSEDAVFARFRAAAREEATKLATVLSSSADDMEVAFVGYFRSGKSTLVNALLGRQLMPSRHDATTLVTTRITYRSTGYGARFVFIEPAELERERLELEGALRDRRELDGLHRALASVGALREGETGPVPDRERIEGLRADVQEGLRLPPVPTHLQMRLGRVAARSYEDEGALLDALRPIIAPEPGQLASGELSLEERALLAEVVLTGPFESLRALVPPDVDPTRFSFVDTPGLGDRAHLGLRVREVLRRADIVCVNLGNHGNLGDEDDRLVREVVGAGGVRRLMFTIAKFDLVRSGEGGSPEQHLLRTERHIRTIVGEASGASKHHLIFDDVPVVPVIARASLLLQLGHQMNDVVSSVDRHLIEDYPDDARTGLDVLRDHLRRMLDPDARARHVAIVSKAAACGALRRCATKLLEVVTEARRLCDLARPASRELTAELMNVAQVAATGDVSPDDVSRFARCVADYLRARGRRGPGPAGGLCHYKCCGEPGVAFFRYRSILHVACRAHRAEVEAIHREAKTREMLERPECHVASCEKPRLAGKASCAEHVPRTCSAFGCADVATSAGKCTFHAHAPPARHVPAPGSLRFADYRDDDDNFAELGVFAYEECGAETVAGLPCIRLPEPGYKRCWQHRGRRRMR